MNINNSLIRIHDFVCYHHYSFGLRITLVITGTHFLWTWVFIPRGVIVFALSEMSISNSS